MITLRVKETATGRQVKGSRDVYESIKEIAQADQETFWIIGYNSAHKEIFRKCLFVGCTSHHCIEPRIIFNRLLLCGASSWVGVHNHPSGSADPSEDDIAITKRLRNASRILAIDMLDHLIICDDSYYSFCDNFWPGHGYLNYDRTGYIEIKGD